MVKKLITCITIAAVAFSVSAQNARLDAMGGAGRVVPDITNIIDNPADLVTYQNQLQGTAYAIGSFGPAIGIKSLGDRMGIGLMALPIDPVDPLLPGAGSGSSVLRGRFYDRGNAALGSQVLLGNLGNAFPTIPHLLFGLNLDPVAIGLDFFLEMTRNKTTGEVDAAGQTNEVTLKESMSNVGGVLSANIDINGFGISPLFGISVPRASGLIETTVPAAKTEVTTEKGLMMTVGAKLSLDVSGLAWVGGFFFTNENYQFRAAGTRDDEFKDQFIDAYLGFTTTILSELLLVTQYDLEVGLAKKIEETPPGFDTTGTAVLHNFRLGLERPINGVWVFDELIPRAGLAYSLYGTKTKSVNSGGTLNEITTNGANLASQVRVTVGLGLTKGIAGIDVNMVLGSWNGVLTGPSVISGTLTLDFGKSSSSSSSRPSSSDESGYQSAPSPAMETPESGDSSTSGSSGTSEEKTPSSGSSFGDFEF